MNDNPPAPLHIDLRLILEAINGGLGTLLVIVAAINFSYPESILVPGLVVTTMTVIQRLLGKTSVDQIAALQVLVSRYVAQNQVLIQEAKPATVKASEEAAAAILPPKT